MASIPPISRFLQTLTLLYLLLTTTTVDAVKSIGTRSLSTCMQNSQISATVFDVTFTPNNASFAFDIEGSTNVSGVVNVTLLIQAYGFQIFEKTINPCDYDWASGVLCPMSPGDLNMVGTFAVDADVVSKIPGIAYDVPDIDGSVRIMINSTEDNTMLACVESELYNGKTVYYTSVSWVTGVIASAALMASAVASTLGHSNTAAHVAANSIALFGYFQAQAIVGMMAVGMPPIVDSWTQNFAWTMGVIKLGFINVCTKWYVRATGGTPSTLVEDSSQGAVSVVTKRSLEAVGGLLRRGVDDFGLGSKREWGMQIAPEFEGMDQMLGLGMRSTSNILKGAIHGTKKLFLRADTTDDSASTSTTAVLRGIDRVAWRAGIESTSLFLTGFIFFLVALAVAVIGVLLFRGITELCARRRWMRQDRFLEFRRGWKQVLKGTVYRLVLIGWPQMALLCLWELTVRDSAAVVVLAVITFLVMFALLAYAAWHVIRIAKRSIVMHNSPAYILYSDPSQLARWGFLYVQYRATAYWFIVPVLGYSLAKACIIAFGQNNGNAEAVALLVLELMFLVGVCVMRPYMDRATNIFNISIAVVNLINSIFLIIFSDLFYVSGIASGVLGVVFFILNAAFALVLLILVIVAAFYALFSKNPDVRYQPMRDDRTSFMKGGFGAPAATELDALASPTLPQGEENRLKRMELIDEDEFMHRDTSYRGVGHGSRDPSPINLPPHAAGMQSPSTGSRPTSPLVAPRGSDIGLQRPSYDDRAPRQQYSNESFVSGGRSLYGGANPSQSSVPMLRDPSHNETPPPQYQQMQGQWHRGAGYGGRF
ncbi:TRP-domain-containing protein [Saitoella complicata NRRL Y-17804]|uniref:TRP-domain-containing protein n=1 Tax=Saitoella complicata (strain BCRC 22490 / CBS 7301 / JCM 7358 / NBRC 10748 / NRRL Y-17804) TaxID=698492 RepID=UPI0008679BC4|nr:TRP-domain-containing protein [Saitoella complicata NRRL Y-17804]ODQ54646.1 TRP-domain-containing protein [Saitoella complicata NRRL Y-17804]